MHHRLIDLIRHGEAEGGPCFRGRRDDPLSPAGWAQLEAATGTRLRGAGPTDTHKGSVIWDRILCSPALRCAQFADHLAERLGLPVQRLDALRERDFGAWEGQPAERLPLEALERFWADPSSYDPPESEPFAVFRQRVLAGWQQLLEEEGQQLLVLTHGGVIRVILGELLGVPTDRMILLEVPPACRSRLRVPIGDGRPSLITHGITSAETAGAMPSPGSGGTHAR